MITGWIPLKNVSEKSGGPAAQNGRSREDDGTILGRAVQFIHEHATHGIHVREVAAHIRASRRWLDGQFVEQLGRTAHEEIVRVQFRLVERLLIDTQLSLHEIAEQCGFRHPEYMSAAFKRRYGVSPSHWRGTRIRRRSG